jgi:membrane protease subunit HflK
MSVTASAPKREDIQMPSQNGNDGPGSPWGGGAKPGSDFEDLVRQGQDRLKRIMPSGGPRGAIVVAVLALVGLGAWTAYFTVPSDSVAVVQRFGKYLKDVPPGLHFKLPLGIDVATIIPVKRQLKQEFGFGTPGLPIHIRLLVTQNGKHRW